jgi:hypothetical protein
VSTGLDLRLLVFVGSGVDTSAVADLAEPPSPGTLAAISIASGGVEHLGATLSWGAYDRLADEFEPAAERLERGTPALIRSARLDISTGICLLAEPAASTVTVSLGAVSELPYLGWFPDDPLHGAELLTWVAGHRAEFDAAGAHLGMRPVRGARTRLVAALRREAAFAGTTLRPAPP